MKKSTSREARSSSPSFSVHPSAFLSWQLGGLGLATLILYALVGDLSKQFIPGEGHEERPILAVLGLLTGAHVLYLIALWAVAVGGKNSAGLNPAARGALWVILGFAIAFRLIQIPAKPIQEIDIYRYLWDGQVTRAGVNPYAYSPAQVDHGLIQSSDGDRLRERFMRVDSLRQVFQLVDHRNVPTVYPPASQAVFLLAALLTPADASLQAHLVVMKSLFVAFDLGTILLLIQLLKAAGKSPLWCLAYAWCPLAIKEIANSGHLDAQAIFFTTLSLLLLVRGQRYLGVLAWAVAILSKWYPLILLPLIVRQLWTFSGQRAAGFSPAVRAGVAHGGPKARRSLRRSFAVIAPLLVSLGVVAAAQFAVWPESAPAGAEGQALLRAPQESPLKGLRAFLTEWEMNDLVFHWSWKGIDALWPVESQRAFTEWTGDWWPWQMTATDLRRQRPVSPAFVLTYLLVGLFVCGFAYWWARGRWQIDDPLITGTFYVLVLFFILNPTCNPWYLLWAVPLLPWAKERVWYLLSAMVLQYYLRFWFDYHYGGRPGEVFFNDVWLWLEWGPFFVLLAAELLWTRSRIKSGRASRAA